ncbi:prealbumin-like fold domain-containing protein, partial [Lysinibacillus sp. GbtcB16]|uniref:prealbumin-like fold domain-containing protein n=1 Tax=Lysinibacillus sp. GbtcB16 TaxID=2824761 RepID=UPI001C307459
MKKVDASNNTLLLSGAEFDLFRKSGQSVDRINTVATNENGIAQFTGLLKGEYIVKESKAPAGYVLNTEEFR